MFTGLVESLGTVRGILDDAVGGKLLIIEDRNLAPQLTIGESVAVNGACLTIVSADVDSFRFQVGPETLLKTNLGGLLVDSRVNLERSLRVGDRFGGHFVQGHVDGVGRIVEVTVQGDWKVVRFGCPAELTELMVSKGSIAVDGVSLTLVDVGRDAFAVMLIPHTSAVTTLGATRPGERLNIETDILAKHVRKLLAGSLGAGSGGQGLA